MTYCYQCGAQLILTALPDDDIKREVCSSCGWVCYQNPRVLVGVHLYHEDKFLWVKRGTEPNRGRWTFPGGFLEQGETLQQAAARELVEETLIEIPPERLVPFGMLSLIAMDQVYISFRCHCEEAISAQITEEVTDWGWFSEHDAPWPELAYTGAAEQVHQTYTWLREGHFPIRVGDIGKDGMHYYSYKSDA